MWLTKDWLPTTVESAGLKKKKKERNFSTSSSSFNYTTFSFSTPLSHRYNQKIREKKKEWMQTIFVYAPPPPLLGQPKL